MSIAEIQSVVARVARDRGPAVIGVGRGWRVGSGTVIAPDRILASAHRVGPEGATISFADDRRETGELVAADRELDVAVLSAPTGDVEPLAWADGDAPGIGAPVIALGNPGGRGLRATLGFVAAEQRSFRGPRGRRITGAIEHTAPLPRGSAGGPLLDPDGRLLGINALRLEGGLIVALGASGGLREAAERLARGEQPDRPFLGVAVAPPRVARRMRRAVGLPERDGLLVRGVEDGSAAERAGVTQGDLIVAAGGREVDGIDALHRVLDDASGNGALELTVVRGIDEHRLEVDLGRAA
jgi:S1-C subfamily serine protease